MEQDTRYIYRVYQEGSFSQTAEKLYLTHLAQSICCPTAPEYLCPAFRRWSLFCWLGNNLCSHNQQMLEQAGFTPKIKMTLAQLVTACRLADDEMGITFIADRMVRSPESDLMFFKMDSELAERHFHILLPKRNYTAHAVRAFADYAVSELKNETRRFLHGQSSPVYAKNP